LARPERRARSEKAGGASPAPTEVNTMSQTIPFTQAAEFLKAHDNYLILTHKRPDGDTIGCAAGLCRALRKLGKTAYVLHNEDATVLMGSYLEGLTAPDGFAPDTGVRTDVATQLKHWTRDSISAGCADRVKTKKPETGYYGAGQTPVCYCPAGCVSKLYRI